MKTQRQERVKGAVRDTFIVSGESGVQAVDELESLTWRDAGVICFGFTLLGLVIFGIYFLAYGRNEGPFRQDSLITGFVTVTAVQGTRIKRWKIRARYLAGLASAMAIVGLFFRFVVQDRTTFAPLHLGLVTSVLLLMWLGIDACEWHKRRRGEALRAALTPGPSPVTNHTGEGS